jgi:hypothetical protein
MRLPLLLRLLPLAIGSLAHAQEPATAESHGLVCSADADCAAPATCVEKVCTAPTAVPVAPPPPPSAFTAFTDRFVLTIGLGTAIEVFPSSPVKVPGTSRGQFSFFGTTRFMIGTRLPERFRFMAVIELGYVTSGYLPSRGADGLSEGAGLELSLDYFATVKPFIRFMYTALVVPLRSSPEGELAYNAYFVSAGIRFLIFDLHLSVGKDFAGGVSPGIGLGLNWLH